MTRRVGPDHQFHRGVPLSPSDRGGLNIGFTIDKGMRLGIMQFGTMVTWLAATKADAMHVATVIRSDIIRAFGSLPYDASTLPLKIDLNRSRHIIEIRLPQPAEVLAANPEMWLAFAERLEANAMELPDA